MPDSLLGEFQYIMINNLFNKIIFEESVPKKIQKSYGNNIYCFPVGKKLKYLTESNTFCLLKERDLRLGLLIHNWYIFFFMQFDRKNSSNYPNWSSSLPVIAPSNVNNATHTTYAGRLRKKKNKKIRYFVF